MWITPFLPRDARIFYPQPNVNNGSFFHRGCQAGKRVQLINSQHFHIPQGLWRKGRCNYRQELMFAVMSRMLFCMLVSPFFSATSTFRMAYNTVE